MNLSNSPICNLEAEMAEVIQTLPDPYRPSCLFSLYTPLVPNEKPVAKLLLNAWSAEYALRILPVGLYSDVSKLSWTLPQAFYATLFAGRAFLASRGLCLSNIEQVTALLGSPRWMTQLDRFRGVWTADNELDTSRLHTQLIELTGRINAGFEAAIYDALPEGAQGRLLATLPTHLKEAYATWRTATNPAL